MSIAWYNDMKESYSLFNQATATVQQVFLGILGIFSRCHNKGLADGVYLSVHIDPLSLWNPEISYCSIGNTLFASAGFTHPLSRTNTLIPEL